MDFKTFVKTSYLTTRLVGELREEEQRRIAWGQRERTFYRISSHVYGKRYALWKASEFLYTPRKWAAVFSRAHALEKYLSTKIDTGKVVIGFNPDGDYTVSLVSVEDEYRRGR